MYSERKTCLIYAHQLFGSNSGFIRTYVPYDDNNIERLIRNILKHAALRTTVNQVLHHANSNIRIFTEKKCWWSQIPLWSKQLATTKIIFSIAKWKHKQEYSPYQNITVEEQGVEFRINNKWIECQDNI